MRIDPRIFISEPFQTCPNCSRQGFGVLMIGGRHYIRRCRDCWHAARYDLPALNKRVVYLDQLAVSNIMMALNPSTPAHRAGRADQRWRELFRSLDRLVKLQLIVCPESEFHRRESLVTPFFDQLKRMYELLSGRASFQHISYIQQLQLHLHLENWLQGRGDDQLPLNRLDVFFSDFNGWQDRFIISVNTNFPPEWIDDFRRYRDEADAGLTAVFERWRAERKSFGETYAEELLGFGKGLVQAYLQHLARYVRVARGLEEPTLDLLGSSAVDTVLHLLDVLREAGVADDQVWPRLLNYLASDSLGVVPSVKLTAMLYAAIARKAVAGQRRPPSRGMTSDVRLVSAFLPYCDAMLLDNEIAAYLREEPLASEVARYNTSVFSANTMESMMEYLRNVEADAPPGHFEKVREVYGPGWEEPFETVYRSEPRD